MIDREKRPQAPQHFQSRKRLALEFFLFSIAIIFVIEFVIMRFVLPVFPGHHSLFWIAAVDSLILITALLPFLYIVVLRPLNRLASEQRIAEELQKDIIGVPEKISDLGHGYVYKSATMEEAKIGGDFFDLFELQDGQVGIVLGDVSGKGLEAARYANFARTAIKAYAFQEKEPARVMSHANELIEKNTEATTFITAFFGIYDPRHNKLRYCSAGHTEGFIKRAIDPTIERLETRSPALGMSLSFAFLENEAKLEAGDGLLLYTDGVIDARRDTDFFGEERLLNELRRDTSDFTKMPDLILQEVLAYSSGILADDIAILVVSPERESAV